LADFDSIPDTMRVCILGGEGYLGWPTSLFLSSRDHDVLIVDNSVKRLWEAQCGVAPLVCIPTLEERIELWRDRTGRMIRYVKCDISTDYDILRAALLDFEPSAIVHYAEQPSAPFSMASRERAVETQRNNVIGTLNVVYAIRETCPDAHLIKLGTMGEYGTPNIDIEEGWLDVNHAGRSDRVLFPKRPGSVYHLSKVHDSANLEFACRTWGMTVTDLNQGVVYGLKTPETLLADGLHTSFHYDAVFGTVLNRFIVQAVAGIPLTVYGGGSQTRGYIDIRDTIRCVEIAVLNPPGPREFRVFNQVTSHYSINHLAQLVQSEGKRTGLMVSVKHISNPRVEMENHYYNPKYTTLQQLGLTPHFLDDSLISDMLRTITRHRNGIDTAQLTPNIDWRT
jgi:UDP-sulfoquinovose synthase